MNMQHYKSKSDVTGKETGILGYDYGDDYITLYFKKGAYTEYTYTYDSCGADHVETMKELADAQHGLNTYVTKIRPPYSSKS